MKNQITEKTGRSVGPAISGLMDSADAYEYVYHDHEFLILMKQNRGQEKYYSLHRADRFLWWKYWAGCFMYATEIATLTDYIAKCREFDRMIGKC